MEGFQTASTRHAQLQQWTNTQLTILKTSLSYFVQSTVFLLSTSVPKEKGRDKEEEKVLSKEVS